MNTWLWDSFEEFEAQNHPIEHAPRNIISSSRHHAMAQHFSEFFDRVHRFDAAIEELKPVLGSASGRTLSIEQFHKVLGALTLLVLNAECIFAYCRPLGTGKAAGEFNSVKAISEHLERYQNEGRSVGQTRELLDASERLREAIHDFLGSDSSFLKNVPDLPNDLKADFIAAWNIMSVGFDEAALIYSGRGLEGVVRQIARIHNIGPTPIERAPFNRILTAFEAKRFVHNQMLVIDEATKFLLQYSRVMRNQSAHPAHPAVQRMPQGYRQQAVIMAQKANELWKKCSVPGVQLV